MNTTRYTRHKSRLHRRKKNSNQGIVDDWKVVERLIIRKLQTNSSLFKQRCHVKREHVNVLKEINSETVQARLSLEFARIATEVESRRLQMRLRSDTACKQKSKIRESCFATGLKALHVRAAGKQRWCSSWNAHRKHLNIPTICEINAGFIFHPDILSRVTGCVLGKLRILNGISTTANGNSKSSMNHVRYSFQKEGNFNFFVCRALRNIKIPKIVSKMLDVSKMKITKWKNERLFHKFSYFFLPKVWHGIS